MDLFEAIKTRRSTRKYAELPRVFVGVYDEEKLKELLQVPASIRIVRLFPLGYRAENRRRGLPESRSMKSVFRKNGEDKKLS